MAYRYLLADSWYASAENLNLVRALGYHFLGHFRLKAHLCTVGLKAMYHQLGQLRA